MEQALLRLEQRIEEVSKEIVQSVPVLMKAFIGAEMTIRAASDKFKQGQSDKPFSNNTIRNNGLKLRVASKRLFESYGGKGPDAVLRFRFTNGAFTVEHGTRVEYAPIHEFGGDINHPGGTPYIVVENGRAVFLKKDGNYPDGVKFTRPHIIRIIARPSQRPALKKFQEKAMPQLAGKIGNELQKALDGQ